MGSSPRGWRARHALLRDRYLAAGSERGGATSPVGGDGIEGAD